LAVLSESVCRVLAGVEVGVPVAHLDGCKRMWVMVMMRGGVVLGLWYNFGVRAAGV
jgi:hypothetical protein